MTIKTKDWRAQINRMTGNPSFIVSATVTVPNSGVTPRLERTLLQDKSFNLRLELKLVASIGDASLQVETDKPVEYKVQGNSNVTGVSIFYEGNLLHRIDRVVIVQD